MRPWPVLLALLLAAPVAAQHVHDAPAAVVAAHDAPPGGRAYVGGLAGFAILDLGDDLVPDFHQQNVIRATLNGAVLFETTADSGHDYDGVVPLVVAWPAEGAYAVEAQGAVVAAGTVEAPHDPLPAELVVDAPATAAALAPVPVTVRLQRGEAIVPHSDAIVEVRRGTQLLMRTHTHTHAEPQRLEWTFTEPGEYTLRVTGYQAYASGRGAEFPPVTVQRAIQVGPGLPPLPPAPPTLPPPLPGEPNAVIEGAAEGPYRLLGTYDPYTTVGPLTQQRLSALVLDPATGRTVQHVDFQATLRGPAGQVFASPTLHEYDGVYELAVRQLLPGSYLLSVDAQADGWKGHIEMPYAVVPAPAAGPAGPAGPQGFGLQAPPLSAGAPANLTIVAQDLLGRPFAHSEVDLVVLDPAGEPYVMAKLHAHDDGLFPFTIAFPREGAYRILAAPSALEGGLVTGFDGAGTGGGLAFDVAVGPGPGLPAAIAGLGGENLQAPAPWGLAALALAAALLAARKRGRRGLQ